jgi:hypothetical protein
MKNLLHDIVSQLGKALAQELMKTIQEQVKLVPDQTTVGIPFLQEKENTELSANQQDTHPFTEEVWLEFIKIPRYKNYSFEDVRDLKRFQFGNNSNLDITLLQNLTNLKELVLAFMQITDISSLKNLVNLTHLNVFNNNISDISPIRNLINLETLNLSNNQITDISVLKDLVNLEWLGVDFDKIKDLSPLKNLVNLKCLCLYGIEGFSIGTMYNDRNKERIISLLHCCSSRRQIKELQKALPNCTFYFCP